MRMRRKDSGRYTLFTCLILSLFFLITTVPPFDKVDLVATAKSEGVGNNTTVNNTPPRILTEEIPFVNEIPFQYRIEAADNETPTEFLTYSINDNSYGAYMEGNEIVIVREERYFYITVDVTDDEGEKASREYTVRVNSGDQPVFNATLVKAPERISLDGLSKTISIGPGSMNDIQYSYPYEEWDYEISVRNGANYKVTGTHGENSSVTVQRFYKSYIREGYYLGSEDLKIGLVPINHGNTLWVNVTLDFLPVVTPFRIVPLVDIANVTNKEVVILAVERDGKILISEFNSVQWGKELYFDYKDDDPVFKKRLEEPGDYNITVEFSLDENPEEEYFCFIDVHVNKYVESDKRDILDWKELIIWSGFSTLILAFVLIIAFDYRILRRRDR